MRHLLTASLAVLAIFGIYSMSSDAAEQIPGPIGGVFRGVDGSHAPLDMPGLVNYQGRLLDPGSGDPIADGTYSVTFGIWDDPAAGTELWSETQNVATSGGVFSVLLGSTSSLNEAVFEATPRYLEVTVGTDLPMTPRQQFTSVAYAFFAEGADVANNAEMLDDIDSLQFLRADVNNGNASFNGNVLVGGTATLNGNNTIGNQTTDVHTVTGNMTLQDNLRLNAGSACVGALGACDNPAPGDGNLSVDGNIRLGEANAETQVLQFDQGIESLTWSDLNSAFALSDEVFVQGFLFVDGGLDIGNASNLDNDALRFDQGTQALQWIEGNDRFSISNELDIVGDLRVGEPSTGDNDIISFDGIESLSWQDATTDFQFTDDLSVAGNIAGANVTATGTAAVTGAATFGNNLTVSGITTLNGNTTLGDAATDTVTLNANTLSIGQSVGTDNDNLNFDAGAEFLRWVEANADFFVSDDVGVDGRVLARKLCVQHDLSCSSLLPDGDANIGFDLVVGSRLGTDDDFLYFDQTPYSNPALAEHLGWIETSTLFELSDDLNVTGTLGVLGSDIHTGATQTELALDPDSDGPGTVIIGDSLASTDSDDLVIPHGSMCIGANGCTLGPTGGLVVEGEVNAVQAVTSGQNIVAQLDLFTQNGGITGGTDVTGLRLNPFANGQGTVYIGTDAATTQGDDLIVYDGGICVNSTNPADPGDCPNPTDGSIIADGSITGPAFDLAERFPAATNDLGAGELVTIGEGAEVRRSDGTPYDARIAGIVSGDPGFILGWETDDNVAVALQGRVPLNVTLENGPIAPGDYLTSSSTPGYAMKATAPGATVGIALAAFEGSDGDRGQVLTFLARGDGHTASAVQDHDARLAALESGDSEAPGGAAPASAARADNTATPTWMIIALISLGTGLALVAALQVSIIAQARRRAV